MFTSCSGVNHRSLSKGENPQKPERGDAAGKEVKSMSRRGRSGSARCRSKETTLKRTPVRLNNTEEKTMNENLAESATPTRTGGCNRKGQKPIAPAPEVERSVTELLTEGENYVGELEGADPCSEKTIKEAIEVVKALEVKTGFFDVDSGKIAIKQGLILKALQASLQAQNKKKRFGWKKFVEQRIKFMGLRKVQSLIQLADRPDLHPYAFLGIHRLLKVLRITKDQAGDDRAGDLFREQGITIPEGQDRLPVELKAQIDDAIARARGRRTASNNGQEGLLKLERRLEKAEKAVDAILEDTEMINQVNRDKVISLKDKLIQLEASLQE